MAEYFDNLISFNHGECILGKDLKSATTTRYYSFDKIFSSLSNFEFFVSDTECVQLLV